MWKRTIKGLVLTFHLAGINNQNFLMRDAQTGSFWQQISGKAISGPLAGTQLDRSYSDELTFGLWRKLAPGGSVLMPVARDASEYEVKDWEKRMAKTRTVLAFPKTPLQPRDLVLGVQLAGDARAYEVSRILRELLIEDSVGGERVLVVVGPDGKSIRVFDVSANDDANGGGNDDSSNTEFYRTTPTEGGQASGPNGPLFMDSTTGSQWSFDGCAIQGKAAGRCLKTVTAVKDYWFDWRNYHPDTTIFRH